MPRKSRNTKQKEIIETVIGQKDEFFTADELFIDVKKIDELIGIATIYRYLKDLRKSEKIFHYMCDGKALYSKNKKLILSPLEQLRAQYHDSFEIKDIELTNPHPALKEGFYDQLVDFLCDHPSSKLCTYQQHYHSLQTYLKMGNY